MRTKNEIKAELKRLKKEYQDVAQTEFKAGIADLFSKYKDLQFISWTQYTPYFNDGDECVFSSHHDYPNINGNDENYGSSDVEEGVKDIVAASEEEIYAGNGDYSKKIKNPDYDPACAKCVKEIKEFLGEFEDDNYKEMFGDHVKVTVTRKGIEIDEYSHD